MWELIRIYIAKYPDIKVITTKPLKKRIKFLERQIQVQLPDADQPSAKRSGEELSSPQQSKRPTRRQSSPTSNMTEGVMAHLTVSSEDRRKYLDR